MSSLDSKLSQKGRWVEKQSVAKLPNGGFRAAILVFGSGGKRRYEGVGATPIDALSVAGALMREREGVVDA